MICAMSAKEYKRQNVIAALNGLKQNRDQEERKKQERKTSSFKLLKQNQIKFD